VYAHEKTTVPALNMMMGSGSRATVRDPSTAPVAGSKISSKRYAGGAASSNEHVLARRAMW